MVSAPKLAGAPMPAKSRRAASMLPFPRCGPRDPIPAGHQGQPQGNAAHRRQTAHPVCGGRGVGRPARVAWCSSPVVQARHRGPLRFRRRTRESAAQAGQERSAEDARSVLPSYASCIYIRQPAPLGLGHAVLCAKPAVGDAPFFVHLADDLIDAEEACLKQMATASTTAASSPCRPCRIRRPTSTAS